MPRKKRPTLTLSCTCGNSSYLKIKSVEQRQIFNSKETVYLSSVENFAFDVIHPVGHIIEIICSNCGSAWRLQREY